jgi:activating signal cointegrator 1
MKVLSLLQPWASLVVTAHPNVCIVGPNGKEARGIKQWETRSWQPKDPTLIEVLKTEGFLIHASKAWKNDQKQLYYQWPFTEYSENLNLAFGCIIGHVKLDQIWSSDKWVSNTSVSESEGIQEEYYFGDYSPGRFAWLLRSPILFKEPIPAAGALGFWNYNGPLPELS